MFVEIRKKARQKLFEICNMVDDHENAVSPEDVQNALQAIKDDLVGHTEVQVQVQGGWHDIGTPDPGDEYFRIIFCSEESVPVMGISGWMINRQPQNVRLEYGDGNPGDDWISYPLSDDEHKYLLAYCRVKIEAYYVNESTSRGSLLLC